MKEDSLQLIITFLVFGAFLFGFNVSVEWLEPYFPTMVSQIFFRVLSSFLLSAVIMILFGITKFDE